MRNQTTIRAFLSGLLLALFALGITPKKFLHDLFAKHKDVPGKVAVDGKMGYRTAGFNCHTEDPVVESPMIVVASMPVLDVPVVFRTAYNELVTRWHSARVVYSSLRGPPARA